MFWLLLDFLDPSVQIEPPFVSETEKSFKPCHATPSTTLSSKAARIGKQRSLSLSEKPLHRIYIRRAVSQEEVSAKDNFAKPNIPDSSGNKKYLVRMRRHSMNDGILSSSVEKINPYFTKSYTRSPHKVRSDFSKSSYPTHSPKRNISVTSFDIDPSNIIRSPPKKNRNLPIEADIFDFKSEAQGVQVKSEPEDEYNGGEPRKSETYSYSLLKGASKTSSVNPCFSSRKTFVKKINSIPSKCVNRLRQEYCSKKGKANEKLIDSPCPKAQYNNTQKQCVKNILVSDINKHSQHRPTSEWADKTQRIAEKCPNLPIKDHNLSESSNHLTPISKNMTPSSSSVSPTPSGTTTDVTMVTSSSMDSLKSSNSSSSGESSKMELLNDSALLSYAIAGISKLVVVY